MSLTEKDKSVVKDVWAKISKSADAIGTDALGRLLTVYPQSKIYFSHWSDLSPGSGPVAAHGKRVMKGVALAVSKIDNLTDGLLDLSEKHAFQMRVDPSNYKLLNHCILVVIASMHPKEFTPEAHCALDKFLTALALALSEKYR